MDIGVRHAVPGLPIPIFLRVHEAGETLSIAAFASVMRGPGVLATGAQPIAVDSAAAQQMAASGDYAAVGIGSIFAASDIGVDAARSAEPEWRLTGFVRYEHGGDGYGRGELAGRQSWLFPVSRFGDISAPFNKYSVGFNTKDHGGSELRRLQTNAYLQIMSPYRGAPLADATLSLVYNADVGFWSNVAYESSRTLAEVTGGYLMTLMPKLDLIAPANVAAGDLATLVCRIVDPVTGQPLTDNRFHREDIRVEATAGYLVNGRIRPHPEAEIKVRAADLEAGDVIKVKVGWANYTGAAEAIVTVT